MFLQVSVWPQRGEHAWLLLGGGMHGCSRGGACVVAPGEWVWLLLWGMCGCSQGVCGCSWGGAWLLWRVHGCSGGHAWFFLGGMHGCSWGGCVVFSGGGMHSFSWGGVHRIRQDTVNERAVRILLECILVNLKIRLTRLGLSFQK